MMHSGKKLRIGIIATSNYVEAWFYNVVIQLQNSDYAEIVIFLNGNEEEGSATGSAFPNSHWLLDTFLLLDRWRYKGYRNPDAFIMHDLNTITSNIPVLDLEKVERNGVYQLSNHNIKILYESNLDILITPTVFHLSEDFYQLCSLGIWAHVHHTKDHLFIDVPAGFWESVSKTTETGSMLVQINSAANESAGIFNILSRSWTRTFFGSPSVNLNYMLWSSASFLPRELEKLQSKGCEEYMNGVEESTADRQLSGSDHYRLPGVFHTAVIAARNIWYDFRRFYHGRFFWEQWHLLVFIGDEWTSISQFKKLMPPDDEFWADPFVIARFDKYYVFIEVFNRKDKQGHIAVLELDSEGELLTKRDILVKDTHMSYPFIFEHDGEIWLIPESKQCNSIELYECQEFPDKWVFKKNLMSDIRAVDTTLFYHAGLWWMFTSIQDNGNHGVRSSENLYIFYTNEPLSDQWIPHRENPVITDTRVARPAGSIFIDKEGRIIRPSQDCSTLYGHTIVFNEILELNAVKYRERVVDKILPDWNNKVLGTHTFSRAKGITVLDALQRKSRF